MDNVGRYREEIGRQMIDRQIDIKRQMIDKRSKLYVDIHIYPNTFDCNKESKIGQFAIEYRVYFVKRYSQGKRFHFSVSKSMGNKSYLLDWQEFPPQIFYCWYMVVETYKGGCFFPAAYLYFADLSKQSKEEIYHILFFRKIIWN